jgi:chemotaxis protein CheX
MADINENELKVFVEAVTRYFSQITREPAQVRSAYLAERGSVAGKGDYTGLISISGGFRGCVYFTAPLPLIRSLLRDMREENLAEEKTCSTQWAKSPTPLPATRAAILAKPWKSRRR